MVAAVRQKVTVGKGGVVEVRSPELKAGVRAEVIVLIDEVSSNAQDDRLQALDALQQSLKIGPKQASAWSKHTRAERRAASQRRERRRR